MFFLLTLKNVSHLFLAFLVLPLNKQMLARLLPLWNYSFLKFLISFTNNDLYSLPHMTSRILVNNGMSKSLWFVISMDGQRVSRRFLGFLFLIVQVLFFYATAFYQSSDVLYRRAHDSIVAYHHYQLVLRPAPNFCILELNCPSQKPFFMRNLYIWLTVERTKIEMQTFYAIFCSLFSFLKLA